MSAAERDRRLKELRRQWRMWHDGRYDELSHIDYCLAPCEQLCGACDGCASDAYRAMRRKEIQTEAAAVKRGAP